MFQGHQGWIEEVDRGSHSLTIRVFRRGGGSPRSFQDRVHISHPDLKVIQHFDPREFAAPNVVHRAAMPMQASQGLMTPPRRPVGPSVASEAGRVHPGPSLSTRPGTGGPCSRCGQCPCICCSVCKSHPCTCPCPKCRVKSPSESGRRSGRSRTRRFCTAVCVRETCRSSSWHFPTGR